MSFDVAPQQDLYTRQGVAVTVEAVAQIKVKSDPESILTAAEQFLTKSDEEREGLIRLVMEGHLRGIIGQLTVEEIVKQPEMVGRCPSITRRISPSRSSSLLVRNCSAAVRIDSGSDLTLICATASTVTATP